MASGKVPGWAILDPPMEYAKRTLQSIQEYSLLAWGSLANLFKRPRYLADSIRQADLIGIGSLPVVLAACFFTGAALALNSRSTLSRFGASSLIGQLVTLGIVRELGPVIAGLVIAGRNAAGIASELGSMIVTEQIDAMRALGTDPAKKLVTPRVVSTMYMTFFLTILGDLFGLLGGAMVSALVLGVDSQQYWTKTWQSLAFEDVSTGLVKPVVFGFLVATIGCYYGLKARGGTQGVGRATTGAVVASMLLIIISDVFVTQALTVLQEWVK
jgi:phospholipid/cholesterol/gamma-HCH transport system permease protein